jgi:CheY-like chemotaxis protein
MDSRRLLIIDDEDDIREVVKLALETTAGWTVVTAASAVEGLRSAEAAPLDAILLDVSMPEVDGPSVFEKLCRNPLTRRVPVLFLTAKVQANDRRRLAALGAAGVIPKPFDPMRLAAEIAEALGWELEEGC